MYEVVATWNPKLEAHVASTSSFAKNWQTAFRERAWDRYVHSFRDALPRVDKILTEAMDINSPNLSLAEGGSICE